MVWVITWGLPGGLNDNADIPAPIYSYKPNAFGLYNMAGNVSEWVLDVYRPNTPMDADEFRPFRGNIFDTYTTLEDFTLEEKDSTGKFIKREVTQNELANKNINYRDANVINYSDGDSASLAYYDYGKTNPYQSLAHVYKGGSWSDTGLFHQPRYTSFLTSIPCSSLSVSVAV